MALEEGRRLYMLRYRAFDLLPDRLMAVVHGEMDHGSSFLDRLAPSRLFTPRGSWRPFSMLSPGSHDGLVDQFTLLITGDRGRQVLLNQYLDPVL